MPNTRKRTLEPGCGVDAVCERLPALGFGFSLFSRISSISWSVSRFWSLSLLDFGFVSNFGFRISSLATDWGSWRIAPLPTSALRPLHRSITPRGPSLQFSITPPLQFSAFRLLSSLWAIPGAPPRNAGWRRQQNPGIGPPRSVCPADRSPASAPPPPPGCVTRLRSA